MATSHSITLPEAPGIRTDSLSRLARVPRPGDPPSLHPPELLPVIKAAA